MKISKNKIGFYLLFLLVCSYFIVSFYLSYHYNEEMLFFTFALSPLEFLALFYIFLALYFYKEKLLCFEKQSVILTTLFFSTASVLFLLEQYSFLILFSFSFLFALVKNRYLLFPFLVYINSALIVLFESGSYILYFFTLIGALLPGVYMLEKLNRSFFPLLGAVVSAYFIVQYYFTEEFFQIYIYFDVVDKELLDNGFIFSILTLLHTSALFIISRNKAVLHRFEKAWDIILPNKISRFEGKKNVFR